MSLDAAVGLVPSESTGPTAGEKVYLPARSPGWAVFFIACGILLPLAIYGALVTVNVILPLRIQAYAREQASEASDDATERRWESVAANSKPVSPHPGALGQALLLGASGALILLGRRLMAKNALQTLRDDPRPPVIYLRAFQDDSKKVGDVKETDLAVTLRKIGPVVAIGQPGERLTDFGASRFYVSNQRWQDAASEMMREACLVVLRAGTSPGLLWEVQRIRETVPPNKVAFFIPFPYNTKLYEQFRAQIAPLIGAGLPDVPKVSVWKRDPGGVTLGHHFLLFDDNWQPQWMEDRLGTVLGKKARPAKGVKKELAQFADLIQCMPSSQGPVNDSGPSPLLKMLDDIERQTVPHPPFHLHPATLLLVPLLIVMILRMPGHSIFLDFDYTIVTRALEGALGIIAALSLAFASWLYRPAQPRLPTMAFTGLLLLHLTLLAGRYPLAAAHVQRAARFEQLTTAYEQAAAREGTAEQQLQGSLQRAAKDEVFILSGEALLDSKAIKRHLSRLRDLRLLVGKLAVLNQDTLQRCHRAAISRDADESGGALLHSETVFKTAQSLLELQDEWLENLTEVFKLADKNHGRVTISYGNSDPNSLSQRQLDEIMASSLGKPAPQPPLNSIADMPDRLSFEDKDADARYVQLVEQGIALEKRMRQLQEQLNTQTSELNEQALRVFEDATK